MAANYGKDWRSSMKSRKMIIQNGAGTGHGSYINVPADKYYRETFFISVHTRNLAIPQVPVTNTVRDLFVKLLLKV